MKFVLTICSFLYFLVMENPVFIVDAFTSQQYAGNQAAVCLLHEKKTEKEYQQIAAEFNFSETAFLLPTNLESRNTDSATAFANDECFELRWFTPKSEVALCGHATLATAHVLFNEIGFCFQLDEFLIEEISFCTKSGALKVSKRTNVMEMVFPAFSITSVSIPHMENHHSHLFPQFESPPYLMELIRCIVPEEVVLESVAFAAEAKKLIVVLDRDTTNFEMAVLTSDFSRLLSIHDGSFIRGIIVTLAPAKPKQQGFVDSEGEPYDYVCRYFAPWVGIPEDPATGSAQCALAPFWSQVLKKNSFYAFQNYPGRGAQFRVTLPEGPHSKKVLLQGNAVTVVSGKLRSPKMQFY